MNRIKLTKGLDIPMTGAAAKELGSVRRPEVFHIVPDHFEGIIPRLMVKEGDRVLAGSPLFHDKTMEAINFAAPVSGTVQAIVRGERRKILSIDILADAAIEYQKYEIPATLTRDAVRNLLLTSGLWSYLKQRPYDCIANPEKSPKAIFISAFDSAPLAPDYEYVLAGEMKELQAAVNALQCLTDGVIHIGLRAGQKATDIRGLKNVVHTEFAGPHPAGNVGVQINHVDAVNKGETVYTINLQDLAIIGRLFTKGIVDMQKKVALTGPLAYEPKYYRVLPGMPASAILASNTLKGEALRYVAGNVLSGHQIGLQDIISPYDNQFTVLASGEDTHEMLGWIMPRFDTFSQNCTAFSWLFENCLYRYFFGKKEYKWDARIKGGRRAIIVSGEYDKVFPMDIYPEYLLKAMIAGNLDKMEALGAYEVAPEDFALCDYVCTSKLPVQQIVKDALLNMKKELE